MVCKHCKADEVAKVSGKVTDLLNVTMPDGMEALGTPGDMPIDIGSGDYVEFQVCLKCNRIQHPVKKTS